MLEPRVSAGLTSGTALASTQSGGNGGSSAAPMETTLALNWIPFVNSGRTRNACPRSYVLLLCQDTEWKKKSYSRKKTKYFINEKQASWKVAITKQEINRK